MSCPAQSAIRAALETERTPIAIFGNGVSAQGAILLLKKIGLPFVIYDENPEKGLPFDRSAAQQHRWAICSPSFSNHPWRVLAQTQGIRCLSELDLASLYTQAPIVAITGTNGKTTITTFLTEFFQKNGIRAWSGGNIGRPLCEVVALEQPQAEDFIFCEVSSFQAELSQYITFAHTIWTNFSPNHLNVHSTLEDYFRAKYRLVSERLHPNGSVFCGMSVAQAAQQMGYALPKNTCIVEAHTAPGAFAVAPQWENYALIEAFCRTLYLPSPKHEAETFTRPPYRLEDLGVINGNHYWNDAKCTNFAALKSALQNFKQPVIWIGGGRSKGENLQDIPAILKGHVQLALLIGETGEILEPILQAAQIQAMNVKNIKSALMYIKNACITGKAIVFSPAFSSFDQFENYMARGKSFQAHVFSLR